MWLIIVRVEVEATLADKFQAKGPIVTEFAIAFISVSLNHTHIHTHTHHGERERCFPALFLKYPLQKYTSKLMYIYISN